MKILAGLKTWIYHDVRNPTFGRVRPAKIQISLRILAVWSEFSLDAFWLAKDTKFLLADNEGSDQTARMRRLIWIFVGRTRKKLLFALYNCSYLTDMIIIFFSLFPSSTKQIISYRGKGLRDRPAWCQAIFSLDWHDNLLFISLLVPLWCIIYALHTYILRGI